MRVPDRAWLVLVAALAGGCDKGPGDPCAKGECGKRLVCEGSSQPVCRACEDTAGCNISGQCTFRNGRCAAVSDEDCAGSELCRVHGACNYDQRSGKCYSNKEGGCPCGCDQSEDMVASLRTAGAAEALTDARSSLATIAEREALGYVTDAMVSHRLRLRGLEADLLAEAAAPATFPLSDRALALRRTRASLPITRGGGLALRAELVAFGATTERVRGLEKDLLPCFRLWLELENDGEGPLVLERPALAGLTRFDVRRWYLEDGDGAPWSGTLAPGERRSVLVIGYIDEPIAPGAMARAEFSVGGLPMHAATTTLGRWDARAY